LGLFRGSSPLLGKHPLPSFSILQNAPEGVLFPKFSPAAYRKPQRQVIPGGCNGTAPVSLRFSLFTRIHIMSSQDTPGRPKSSASRQQTQPNQGAQSGSPEVDTKDAGSEEAQRKNRSRPAEEQEHEIAVPQPQERRK
jgi:hypothetical protein